MAVEPDGVLLGNGPGDPAALPDCTAEARELVARVPVFGICLGHQLLGRALGLETFKLRFGHRGANHPVLEVDTGRVLVTAQNHGFAVRVPEDGGDLETDFGPARVTHVSLYDGTVEGLELRDLPVGSMQFHPEASPGPHDAREALERFVAAHRRGERRLPRRDDIETIAVIGSGPIVIGQACEFDYSGTQALRVLREEGYRTVLVNSNPATIMTDPGWADRTYLEPLDVAGRALGARAGAAGRAAADAGRPDRAQPGLAAVRGRHAGGARDRADRRVLRGDPLRRGPAAVRRDDGADRPARAAQRHRPLAAGGAGGAGGGAAGAAGRDPAGVHAGRPGRRVRRRPRSAFEEIVARGLRASPIGQVLIEESVAGWGEFELEVIRDRNDNVVIICSIENVDPMGVHTGDSVTVAPAQTLSDREYQVLRDASAAVIRAVGVETGGSNVQFALNRETGELVVIEMNPRVSRSSALASKATGYPIAKVATKLAVGYTLDEIPNDITGTTPASFEPTLDYVVIKLPRFAFEKFPGADDSLTTHMKSVGEVMGIGRSFNEAWGKAMRSRELDGIAAHRGQRRRAGVGPLRHHPGAAAGGRVGRRRWPTSRACTAGSWTSGRGGGGRAVGARRRPGVAGRRRAGGGSSGWASATAGSQTLTGARPARGAADPQGGRRAAGVQGGRQLRRRGGGHARPTTTRPTRTRTSSTAASGRA